MANNGLMDQIAALKWVQENVKAFGGDPDSITVFGHNYGAASIHFLMQSPIVLPGNIFEMYSEQRKCKNDNCCCS